MEDPVKDIPRVIRLLTQTPPSIQEQTIDRYFTPDAEFEHPFCRTSRFSNSRYLIHGIYRWYKIMSPRIDARIHSVAYDATNLILYVTMSQVFRIWFLPLYKAPVTLTTVLHLVHDKPSQRYYIKRQNDLYQTNEFLKFCTCGGDVLAWVFQFFASIVCLVLAWIFTPVTWVEERVWREGWIGVARR